VLGHAFGQEKLEIARAGEFVLDVLTKARAFDIDYHQLELALKMAEVYPQTFKSTHSLIQQKREFRDTSHALFKYL
jgi:UDP-N-acetylglucosamine transferase subunit ALG13